MPARSSELCRAIGRLDRSPKNCSAMHMRRVTITLPRALLAKVDACAKERGESRSSFIRQTLSTAFAVRRDRKVTQRLDQLFADEALAAEQLRCASELDRAGADGADGSWD